MALTTANFETLFRQGRYAQIVTEFDWNALAAISQEQRVLLAQAAFHSGRIASAFDIAKRENTSASSAFIRAECEAIFGLIDKRQGDWRSAIKHFQSSLHWAKEARVPVQIGWSSLRLFRVRAEVAPGDALAALS